MEKFKIDQVSKESGLTKRTLRYYEEIGILPPPIRSEGGVRYYSQEHINLLKIIKNIKEALGLSLEELQNVISLSKMLEDIKLGCKQLAAPNEKKQNLIRIIEGINEELFLVEKRMEKIEEARGHLLNLKKEAEAAVEKIHSESLISK